MVKWNRTEMNKRVGNMRQMAGITPFCYTQGTESGIRAFDVETGDGLQYVVLQDKCLDIFNVRYRGIPIHYAGKAGLRAPSLYDASPSRFPEMVQGGMMFTCGLSNVGSACTIDGVDYPIHGTIHATPAAQVGSESFWREDRFVTQIKGTMNDACLFGKNLQLHRTIESVSGDKSIKIHDVLTNSGFEDEPFMLLYHINFGHPMLSEQAMLSFFDTKVVARDEDAQKGLDRYAVMEAPVVGKKEQVYYHDVQANEDGFVTVRLTNSVLGVQAFVRYEKKNLQNLVQWKSMRAGDYVLGIEPCNCRVEGRAVQADSKEGICKIGPGEAIRYQVEIGFADLDSSS